MSIRENLIRLRVGKTWSQVKLAEVAGVSQQLISQIERGVVASTKELPNLARALGVPVGDLDPAYGGSPTPQGFPGFSEGEATRWIPQGGLGEASSASVEAAINALSPQIRSRQIYRIDRAFLTLAILKGDIAVAEARHDAGPGDLVIANHVNVQTTESILLVRRFFPPYLVDASADDSSMIVTTDHANVVAKIVAVFRSPLFSMT